MILDVEFEQCPLDGYIETLAPGTTVSAAQLLTQCGDEEELEFVFERLEEMGISIDLAQLPAYADYSSSAQRLALEKQFDDPTQIPESLPQNDPLRLYLEELAARPAFGDTNVLISELAAGKADAEQLFNLSASRVVELALEFTGYGVLLLDLIQEGSMGLWTALAVFTDGDFEYFRDYKIRFAMAKAVVMQAQSTGIGQKMRQAVEDFRATDQRLLAELGRNPTLEEIAQALHMEISEAVTVSAMLESARLMVRPEQKEQEPQEEDQAVEDTAYFAQRQRILEMLSTLTEQEAQLLNLRYGLEGGKPMSAAEVGLKLGLTAAQTVELEASALEKLRKQ